MIKQWSANAGSPGQKLYFTVGDLAPNVSYAVHKGGSTLLTLNSGETGRIAFSDVAGSTNGVHYSVEPDLQTFVQRGPNGFVISWTGGWLQRATTLSPPNWQNVPTTNGQFSIRINPFEPMEFFRTGVGP